MRIDWQAYLDGSLDPQAMADAERELRENPAAQKELDGLKSFVSCVRAACLAEEVPHERLGALMPAQKPSGSSRISFRPNWAYGLAAAAVLAFAVFRFAGQGPGELPIDLTTSDPGAAAKWASARLSMSIPAIDLGPDAPLFYAHGYGERCCFDYKVDGKAYHVNIERRKTGDFKGSAVKLQSGSTAYVDRGVKWVQGEYQLFVVGPDKGVALEVANRTSTQLQRT